MFTIDYEKLHSLERAFVIYEIAKHGVDPRETLDGTTFRIYELEGYKQKIYDEVHRRVENGGPYVDIASAALKNNLVDYHQKIRIANMLGSDNRGLYETALSSLYAGDDEAAFKDVVDAFGGSFDVVGALYFFKDSEKYLPVRSKNFDDRFRILGADAGLAGNCTWNKYQEYNETIKAIQKDLNKNVNKEITLIDAHSFVWILPGIVEYENSVHQLVEHEKLGIGEIISREPYGIDDEKITVKFVNKKDPVVYLRSYTIDAGKNLKLLEPKFDIDGTTGKGVKNPELQKAITSIDVTDANKYIVILSDSGNKVYMGGYLRAPYHDITGKPLHYWDTISKLKPGDVVFKYTGGYIDAVGIVTSFCSDVPISDLKGETAEWGDTRRQVEYKPYPLNEPIKISDYKDEIIKFRKERYSAFNKDGGANEGYLYELEPEIASLFERVIGINSVDNVNEENKSDNIEGYTITQADIDRIKEKDAQMTPEERRELSKTLIEAASMPKSWLIGTFSSWTVVSESVAIKQCDKSFFDYRGSTIPREVYWFFDADGLNAGEKKDIKLIYNDQEYSAYLQREIHELARIRIFWEQSLADEFDEYNVPGKYPKLVFSKKSDLLYDIALEEKPLSNKAIEVAEALLKLIANRTRLTTYGELSDMTKSKPSPYYEMRMLLDAINKRCDKLGLPYISAMVVNKSTGLPGEGFRDLCIDYFGYDPEMTTEEIFEEELDRIGKCDEWSKLADYLGIEMPTEDEEPLPEEVEDVPGEPIMEGAKKTITVNSYERDSKAKNICKDFYMKRDGRIKCQVCGFDFGEVYGPEYANKIHVHHIVPISEIGEEYIIDPIKDLIPVCPNCHMILHAGKGISVEALRKRLKKHNQ